jgi:IclR family transcriptional regulator, acetate operon repressor
MRTLPVRAPEESRWFPRRRSLTKDEGLTARGARSESVQSLVRALAIINRLSEAEGAMTLTRIAESVDLAPSTVHRLLTTLEQERYVRFDPERRLWSVGVQTFVAGCAFLKTRDLIGVARPYMRALMEECRETVNLAVQDEREAMYIHQIENPAIQRPLAKPGARVPLYCCGVGKALLAAKTDGELEGLLPEGGARRLTANTIVSPSALREDIALIRERGFAVDDEEHAIGLRCVAALVFNEFRESMAAISISGPATRISPSNIVRLGELLRQKAAGITARLGGSSPAAPGPV